MDEPVRARKRPVEIEGAIQWTGDNAAAVKRRVGETEFGEPGFFLPPELTGVRPPLLWVAANREWLGLETGEWILKDRHGFYPCKDDVWQESYEVLPR